MKSTDKLKEWAEREKENGLLDIKFFRGTTEVSVEEAARVAREALESNDVIALTDDDL